MSIREGSASTDQESASLRKRLEQLGAMVDPRVGIETHYLVLGAPESEDENLRDSDAYKQAVELGVKVITEAQLETFMNY